MISTINQYYNEIVSIIKAEVPQYYNTTNKFNLIQFSFFDRILLSDFIDRNIFVPKILNMDNFYISDKCKYLDYIIVTNDYHEKLMQKLYSQTHKIHLPILFECSDTYSAIPKYQLHKFATILRNYNESLLEDVIQTFYYAYMKNPHIHLTILIQENPEIISNTKTKIYQKFYFDKNIKNHILFIVKENIETKDSLTLLNSTDSALFLDILYDNDYEMLYALYKNKNVFTKYPYFPNTSIIDTHKKLEIYKSYIQYDHPNVDSLYNVFKSTTNTKIKSHKFIEHYSTGIDKCLL